MKSISIGLLTIVLISLGCYPDNGNSIDGLEISADQCQDTVDNDTDGHTDCDDQDCQLFVFCAGDDSNTETLEDTDTNVDTDSLLCYQGDLIVDSPSDYETYQTVECVLGEFTINFSNMNYSNFSWHLSFNSLQYVKGAVRITSNKYLETVQLNGLKLIDCQPQDSSSCYGIKVSSNEQLKSVSFYPQLYIAGTSNHGNILVNKNPLLNDIHTLISASKTNVYIEENPLILTCDACEIAENRRDKDVLWLVIKNNKNDKCYTAVDQNADCNKLNF